MGNRRYRFSLTSFGPRREISGKACRRGMNTQQCDVKVATECSAGQAGRLSIGRPKSRVISQVPAGKTTSRTPSRKLLRARS